MLLRASVGNEMAMTDGPAMPREADPAGQGVFETARLRVRLATEEDAEFYFGIWTDSSVMRFVGYPHGLRITLQEVRDAIRSAGNSPFERRLLVVLKETGQRIGDARMHPPGPDGVARTDVKLVPSAWGHRYGTEVKAGLIQYLFAHTDCRAVEGTPNKGNLASIRMQEAVGGVCVGEGVFEFPEEVRDWTRPVPHFVYHVRRSDWKGPGAWNGPPEGPRGGQR